MSEPTPAYTIAALDCHDMDTFMSDYGQPAFATLMEAGVEVLAATPDAKPLEGSYAGTWTVILKFASMQALQDWYATEAYQKLIPVRQAVTNAETSLVLAVPGFEGADA